MFCRHIMKERQRKKQMEEAEVKEEQLRKEKEARDVSTLGNTRDKIKQVDSQLRELRDKKQQLVLELKRLLVHEDANLKKIRQKEAQVVYQIPQYNPNNIAEIQPQLYEIVQQKQINGPQTVQKRGREIEMSEYYKAQQPQPIFIPQKADEGRRNEMGRATLWNKYPKAADPYIQHVNTAPVSYLTPPKQVPGMRFEVRPSRNTYRYAAHQPNIQLQKLQQVIISEPASIEKINDRQYIEIEKDKMRTTLQQQQEFSIRRSIPVSGPLMTPQNN